MAALVDFGLQPIASWYLLARDAAERAYPLVLGQCHTCGLVQLVSDQPPFALRVYNEPDDHLEALAAWLPGRSAQGIGVNDEPLLALLRSRGVDTNRRSGAADLVVARFALEHAPAAAEFLQELHNQVAKGGYLLVEVPDSVRAFQDGDAGAIWEEHTMYFTASSLRQCVSALGYEVLEERTYPHAVEDSLVVLLRAGRAEPPDTVVQTDLDFGRLFVTRLEEQRRHWRKVLGALRADGQRIGLFGGGHRSCLLINILGLTDFLDCVLDDDPLKTGRFMPGSRLPILPSTVLLEDRVSVCVFNISPAGQRRVMERYQAFGGRVMSIAADTPAPVAER